MFRIGAGREPFRSALAFCAVFVATMILFGVPVCALADDQASAPYPLSMLPLPSACSYHGGNVASAISCHIARNGTLQSMDLPVQAVVEKSGCIGVSTQCVPQEPDGIRRCSVQSSVLGRDIVYVDSNGKDLNAANMGSSWEPYSGETLSLTSTTLGAPASPGGCGAIIKGTVHLSISSTTPENEVSFIFTTLFKYCEEWSNATPSPCYIDTTSTNGTSYVIDVSAPVKVEWKPTPMPALSASPTPQLVLKAYLVTYSGSRSTTSPSTRESASGPHSVVVGVYTPGSSTSWKPIALGGGRDAIIDNSKLPALPRKSDSAGHFSLRPRVLRLTTENLLHPLESGDYSIPAKINLVNVAESSPENYAGLMGSAVRNADSGSWVMVSRSLYERLVPGQGAMQVRVLAPAATEGTILGLSRAEMASVGVVGVAGSETGPLNLVIVAATAAALLAMDHTIPVAVSVSISTTEEDSSPCKKFLSAAVAAILLGATPGRISDSIQYIKSGGYTQAELDFDSLHPTDVRVISGGYGRYGRLCNGKYANVRTKSSYGDPTLEIQYEKSIKIRYK